MTFKSLRSLIRRKKPPVTFVEMGPTEKPLGIATEFGDRMAELRKEKEEYDAKMLELERLRNLERRLIEARDRWDARHAKADPHTTYKLLCSHTAEALDFILRDRS